jgi:phosphatidylglycerophosphate synthase
MGVLPNEVSLAGVAFAMCASLAYCLAPGFDRHPRAVALLIAAVAIQLRLLCNLLDGMLAVEEGLKSKSGEIYNDLPDRVADVCILVGAGYGARDLSPSIVLGWMAAVLALFTAYVRILGGSLGLRQQFMGPMAKPQRMFILTVATVAGVAETLFGRPPRAISIGLGLIVAGSILTAVRRTRRIVREIEAR